MADAVDVFDILRPVLARDGSDVHLAPLDWASTDDQATLCGRPISGRSLTMSFRRRGCLFCARRAVDAGIAGVRDTNRAVVNLMRFIADRAATE